MFSIEYRNSCSYGDESARKTAEPMEIEPEAEAEAEAMDTGMENDGKFW